MEATHDLTEIWARLETFSIGSDAAELTFTKRLARENGWGEEYAARVFDEYRRFLFLSVAAGHTVTPSDEVDQAWHLHLTYTDSYWNDLCPSVLGVPLHHGPTKGGSDETAVFVDYYARTLDSYEYFFGELPPADIWPSSEIRFGEAASYRRVNSRHHWIVVKPSNSVLSTAAVALLTAALGSAVSGAWAIFVLALIGVSLMWMNSVLVKTSVYRHMAGATGWSGCGGIGCGGGCGGCGGGCGG